MNAGSVSPAHAARASAGSLVLEYESLALRIGSTAAAPLAWLEEFLSPAFGRGRTRGPATRDVTLTLDPAQYDALVATRAVPAGEIDCFTLDGRFVRYPAWRSADGRVAVHDTRAGAVYLDGGDGGIVVVAQDDTPSVRRGLMRVVRELATAHLVRRGYLHLHAAAAETAGRVVAFAGPRRSGKSTLLLRALTSGGARYVTSDRLMVPPSGDPPVVRAMPTIVSLRDGTFERFEPLESRIAAAGYAATRTRAEAAALVADGRPRELERLPDGRFRGITPAQLCHVTGAGASPGGPLALVALASIVPGGPPFAVRALPPEEAAPRIRRSLLLGSVPERLAPAFDGGSPPFFRDEAALDALSLGLARAVRCVEVRLGPETRPTTSGSRDTVWEGILEHLG